MSEAIKSDDDEFFFLDNLVIIAESWGLLAAGVIITAVLGFIFAFLQPVPYRVAADVTISSGEIQYLFDSSPALLEDVTVFNVDVAGGWIDGSSRITVTANSLETAQEQLTKLLNDLEVAHQPFLGERLAQLQSQLDQVLQRIAEIDTLKQRLIGASNRIESHEALDGTAFAELAGALQRLDDERYSQLQTANKTQKSIDAISTLVLQLPPPRELSGRRSVILTTAAAGIAGGALLLAFVFIRHRIRVANQSPAGFARLERVRRAFLRRGQPDLSSPTTS